MDFPFAASVLASDRRHDARVALRIDVDAIDRHGAAFDLCIVNLSAHGMMVETQRDLIERAPLRLLLPGLGWVRGTVAWALGDSAGIRLRDALSTGALAQLNGASANQPERSIATPASRSNR